MADVPLVLAFLFGILSFISPCIIPMIAVYFTAITGFSLEQLVGLKKTKHLTRHVFFSTLVFVAAFSLVFILLGTAAGFLGEILSSSIVSYTRIMEILAGIVFLIFSLQLLGVFNRFQIPILHSVRTWAEEKMQLKRFRKENGFMGLFGVFLIGFFFAIVCSHCFGYTFYPLLVTAAASSSFQVGALTLLAFSIGLAIPFLLMGLFFSTSISYLHFAKTHARLLSKLIGVMLLIFAILFIAGWYADFQGVFMQYLPDVLTSFR
jgi:cytochrome c-type biogenesis protein